MAGWYSTSAIIQEVVCIHGLRNCAPSQWCAAGAGAQHSSAVPHIDLEETAATTYEAPQSDVHVPQLHQHANRSAACGHESVSGWNILFRTSCGGTQTAQAIVMCAVRLRVPSDGSHAAWKPQLQAHHGSAHASIDANMHRTSDAGNVRPQECW